MIASLSQLLDCLEWRTQNEIDNILTVSFVLSFFFFSYFLRTLSSNPVIFFYFLNYEETNHSC